MKQYEPCKPDHPKKPRKPDLRHVKDPSEKARQLAAFEESDAMVAWMAKKKEYDEELYPTFETQYQQWYGKSAVVAAAAILTLNKRAKRSAT